MNEETISKEWSGVYELDDQYVSLEPAHQSVLLQNYITGEAITAIPYNEFDEFIESNELTQITPDVVENPDRFVSDLLFTATEAVNGGAGDFQHFSPTDVNFPLETTTITTTTQ